MMITVFKEAVNTSIVARLRDASADQSAMDVRAALDAMICLKDLTTQITIGRLTDDLGHDFQFNDAFMRAVELLAQIGCDGVSGSV